MSFAKKDRNISTGVILLVSLSLFLVAFIFYIVASNQKFFDQKYTIYMYLPNAQGLNPGAFITLSGLKVGVVGRMKIINEPQRQGVNIALKIDRDYRKDITASSTAMIKTLGILGDKYVDISIGNSSDAVLQAEQYIRGDPGVDPYEFFDEVAEIIVDLRNVLRNTDSLTTLALQGRGALGKLMVDPETEKQVTALVRNLSDVSGKVARGQGTVGKLIQDTTMYARLDNSAKNLNDLIADINAGKGTLGQLLKDNTFFPRLKSLATNTDSLIYKLQHGGTAAAFLNDPQLYQNLSNLSRSLDSLVMDLKKRPSRYVKFELF